MKNTEVIARLSEQTGLSAVHSAHIVKAFEGQWEHALAQKFRGNRLSHEEILAGVCAQTGLPESTCRPALDALDAILHTGLTNKLRFGRP